MFATSRLARRPLLQVRSLATTAAPTHFAAQQAAPSHTTYSRSNIIPLSNVEAQWESMNLDDKILVQEQLEELQKRDWKGLSIDEKKAAYYVAFGPHGPRAPAGKPGDGVKIFLSVLGLVGATGVLAAVASWAIGGETPRTLNKEWEEATNERALEQKLNPITGIASEGYSGKGFVTSK